MAISPSRLGLGFFVVLGLLLFSAPFLQASDSLIVSASAEPSNLIPFFASDSASAEISRLIFNGLVKYDKNLKLTGDLAESWEILDGGKRIVFHLRKNVRWQDGKPFTAADVRFTFEKLKDPNTPTPYGGDFEKVESLTATDDYTVEVVYREIFSPGLASWGMGIVPEHLLKNENLLSTPFSRKPVGTGPFILKKWAPGQKIELERNTDYFEGPAGVERIVFRILPDASTAFLELQTENLDSMGLTPLQFDRQSNTAFLKEHYSKFNYPSFSYSYIGYNLKNKLFSDVRVRKAIGLAISKQEIVDVTLLGHGRVATGPFLPGTWAYDDAVKASSFDPEKAKALLKEVGWQTGRDGILQKDGQRFSFTLLTNFGNDTRKQACEMVQRRLKEIGIEVKIQVVEWGIFLREYIDKKNFEAVLLAWQLAPDPDIFDIFHSSRQAPGQFNYVSYENKDVDRFLEEGRHAFDETERAKAYHEIHRILAEEEPYTFLYVPDALPILHKRFKNVELTPAGISHNLIHWQVDEREEKYKTRRAV